MTQHCITAGRWAPNEGHSAEIITEGPCLITTFGTGKNSHKSQKGKDLANAIFG